MDDEVLPSRTRLTDRYVLCGEIGSGGMARVHVGRLLGSAAFARTVAIKRLLPRYAEEPEFRLMLTDEARLAARVRHPHVVQTLEVGSADDELFIVMEYIDGVSFGRLLRRAHEDGTRIPEPILAALIAHVLEGLHAAHEATDEHGAPLSIVHRDISPDNVLVGADGFARVLDFGIAKASSRLHSTRDGKIKGKLAYMAPEQLSGRATRQSDVFAASILLWEGLVGQRLFQADDDGETIGRVLATVVEPPASLVPGVTPRLSEIVMRGLARELRDRWPTARDMALAIEAEVPLATRSQIAAWVEAKGGDWLAERRALVRRVEGAALDGDGDAVLAEPPSTGPGTENTTIVEGAGRPDRVRVPRPRVPTEVPAPPRARTRGYVIAAALFAALAIVLVMIWQGRTTAADDVAASGSSLPAPPAAATTTMPPTAAAATPTPAPTPAEVASEHRGDEATTPASTSRHGGARAAMTRAPSSTPSKPAGKATGKAAGKACDPPYRLGPLGEKIWLKECL